MTSKLCCTTEQESRSGSPVLPNARINAAIPAKLPLLPKQTTSPNSNFTSCRSGDLHELQEIFNNAKDHVAEPGSPLKSPRLRTSRQSLYSLHRLHKMTSMRSILRRKFSKDMARKVSSASGRHTGKNIIHEEPETVVRHLDEDSKQQLKVTKDNLRRDLLSDKTPAEGGYDSDAEVLDDVARNIGKKTPSKRPSIHSVEWSPSTGSKSTPGSSSHRRNSTELRRDIQPYQVAKPQLPSLSTRIAQVFSTPNLRADDSSERDRRLRRSHSATSMGLPKPSPLSPLRLPSLNSLTSHDQKGIPWSEIMSESLRLSQFPIPPRHASLKPSKTLEAETPNTNEVQPDDNTEHIRDEELQHNNHDTCVSLPPRVIEIRIQQPTSVSSPRQSSSVRLELRENEQPVIDGAHEDTKDGDGEENHRRSVHLYSMRISHHLRSGSLLSWDQLADAPDLPVPPQPFRQRTVSDQSRFLNLQAQLARSERQTSSSGFASNKVPNRWGKVLSDDRELRADVASSIYSSRPQSPPDSFGGSMVNLSQLESAQPNFSQSSHDLRKLRRSSFVPTDDEETPRPPQRYGVTNLEAAQECPVITPVLATSATVVRKNSVADTKKSKFREEFSPSPPRKKLTPSTSIMKFLNPKRLSLRSLSEANLRSDAPTVAMDGHFDTLPIPVDRERRESRSVVSLQAEQEALGKSKGTDHVWDKALKAHQQEKATMFLPENKELAVHASPFRERSGSTSSRKPSFQDDRPVEEASTLKRFSVPIFTSYMGDDQTYLQGPAPRLRRSATVGEDDISTNQGIVEAFESQGDGIEVVGAWGRYPSHTRAERTLSFSKKDHVDTRDFALEAAVRFASGRDNNHDEDLIDPTERIPSPPLLPGEKKRKKRVGTGKMAKSHSMTFGRKLIKNYYSGMFKSSSSEFRQHGRGHRSSIASGGTLEHPELELLPEVFMSGTIDGAGGSSPVCNNKQVVRRHSERRSESKSQGKLPMEDSMATLRPRRNSSAPNLKKVTSANDGANDSDNTEDRARVWSIYYETCVPSFPSLNTEAEFVLDDLSRPAPISPESKRVSTHSQTMPLRHSRRVSQLSHKSHKSHGSAQLRSLSMDGGDTGSEAASLVSVRRSTMDLISKFKEQENREHDRILSLDRADSKREVEHLAAL